MIKNDYSYKKDKIDPQQILSTLGSLAGIAGSFIPGVGAIAGPLLSGLGNLANRNLANGGYVEVENKEFLLRPNNQYIQFNGNTHEKGGISYIPKNKNEFVFSNRIGYNSDNKISYDNVKTTFANAVKDKIKEPRDMVKSNTVKQIKLDNLKALQKLMYGGRIKYGLGGELGPIEPLQNPFYFPVAASELNNDIYPFTTKIANGVYPNPDYKGYQKTWLGDSNDNLDNRSKFPIPIKPIDNPYVIMNPRKMYYSSNDLNHRENIPKAVINHTNTKPTVAPPVYNPNRFDSLVFGNTPKEDPIIIPDRLPKINTKEKSNKVSNSTNSSLDNLGLLAKGAGLTYNLIKGLTPYQREIKRENPYKTQVLSDIQNLKFNNEAIRNQINLQRNAALTTARDRRGPNVVSAIQANIDANTQQSLALSKLQEQQAQNQLTGVKANLLNQIGEAERQNLLRMDDLNSQNRAARNNFQAQTATDLSRIGTELNKMSNSQKRETIMQMLTATKNFSAGQIKELVSKYEKGEISFEELVNNYIKVN